MDTTSTLMIHSYKKAPASLSCSHVFADSRVLSSRDWCSSRRLQLNADKTEFIVFGSKVNLKRLNQADVNLRLDSAVTLIHPSESVRDLGVQLDRHLTMIYHIVKIALSCFYHLRRLRQLRRIPDQTMLQRLVSIISHRLLQFRVGRTTTHDVGTSTLQSASSLG